MPSGEKIVTPDVLDRIIPGYAEQKIEYETKKKYRPL